MFHVEQGVIKAVWPVSYRSRTRLASGGVPRETGSFYPWGRHVSRETPVGRAMKTTNSAYVPRGTVRALAFIRKSDVFHVEQVAKRHIVAVYGIGEQEGTPADDGTSIPWRSTVIAR